MVDASDYFPCRYRKKFSNHFDRLRFSSFPFTARLDDDQDKQGNNRPSGNDTIASEKAAEMSNIRVILTAPDTACLRRQWVSHFDALVFFNRRSRVDKSWAV